MTDRLSAPFISIVVVNYNGKKFLPDCFRSIFRQTYSRFETILVDNGSRDDSIEYTQQNFPEIKILSLSDNRGFAGGTNAGIRVAIGDFILTLNNDTILTDDFIEELIKPMVSDSSVGICASKMLFPDGKINSTAICISRSGAAWDRGMGEPDNGQYNVPEEVFGACAGAALYRRSMLDEIGLFDEDFFLFMEDVDLSFRARLAGWKCIYVPTARVVHFHGGTAGFRSDFSIYFGNRNLIWYVIKDFPARTLLLSAPWIIGRNFADIPYYILKGQGMAIIRAKIDMIKGFRTMVRKRDSVKKILPEGMIEHWIQMWSHATEPK